MQDATTCTVTLNNGHMQLPCRQGMTLFAALRTHRILLPSGCGARGKCGQCKVTLQAGQASPITESETLLLTPDELAQGKRLGCQLRLTSDMQVSVPEYIFDAKERSITLEKITPLTPTINRFSFALETNDHLPHRAGQFISLIAKVPEHGVVMRCFSLSTPAKITNTLDIIVRRTPQGIMTPFLFEQAKAGDVFKSIGPYGDFYMRDTNAPAIWIGGGSGLSPFLGMLQDLIDTNQTRPVHLFFGAVSPEDLYYASQLSEVARKHSWFTFTPSLSGDERCIECLEYGLVTNIVDKYIPDASRSEAYLCGSPGMIKACIAVLQQKGIKDENVFYDRF